MGEKQVAISMPSTPSTDRNDAAPSSLISPRSSATSKVMPFEFLHSGIGTSHPQEQYDPEGSHAKRPWQWHPKLPRIEVSFIKKVVAEFIGTFILIFTVLSTIIMNEQHDGVESLLGIATSAGLAVTVIVCSIIHISGSHLNPAVSIAMAVFGHLPLPHVVPYVTAQMLGSISASFLAMGLYHPTRPGITTIPSSIGLVEAFFLEFIVTFVLVFVITAVATDPHAVKELIAVAVGATIMMNALVAGPSTGASMNPARTLGPAIATGKYTHIWIYMLATPFGAVAGMGTYTFIKL